VRELAGDVHCLALELGEQTLRPERAADAGTLHSAKWLAGVGWKRLTTASSVDGADDLEDGVAG
jgi:hypothetical protein